MREGHLRLFLADGKNGGNDAGKNAGTASRAERGARRGRRRQGLCHDAERHVVRAQRKAGQSGKKAAGTGAKANFTEFATEDIKFAYCTECIVEKSKEHLGEGTCSALYDYIRAIGDSAVFVDAEDIIKLHIHTNDPGLVLNQALLYGALATVK